jgi:hypothetical protein
LWASGLYCKISLWFVVSHSLYILKSFIASQIICSQSLDLYRVKLQNEMRLYLTSLLELE